MSDAVDAFLTEGLRGYNQAQRVMIEFRKSLNGELVRVLRDRTSDHWGPFTPTKPPLARPRDFGSPDAFGCNVPGQLQGKKVHVWLEVGWSGRGDDSPYLYAGLGPRHEFIDQMTSFDWSDEGMTTHKMGNKCGVRVVPQQEGPQPPLRERLTLLLDELVRFMKWRSTQAASRNDLE